MSSMIKRKTEEAFFKQKRVFPRRSPGGFPIGPRTRERQKQNAKLNKLPDSVKKVCELKIPGVCAGNIMLTWCHSKKSRFITTDKDWQEAARGCLPCHDFTEAEGHVKMKRRIIEAIKRRKPTHEST